MTRFLQSIPLAFVLALALLLPAAAQSPPATKGPLSDRALYDLVTCNVAPGTPCREPRPKWPASRRRHLTVAIVRTDPGFGKSGETWVREALAASISEINAVGADLKLVWVDAKRADIEITLSAASGTGGSKQSWAEDARKVNAVGYVSLRGQRDGRLEVARIQIYPGMSRREAQPVMLANIARALGLFGGIDNPYYRERSIFYRGGSMKTRLGKQDAALIRLHYPPGGS